MSNPIADTKKSPQHDKKDWQKTTQCISKKTIVPPDLIVHGIGRRV
jgi:hypothetical protein